MKMHGLNRLTGLGLASLCLAWSGLTYAGGPPPGFVHTTVSKASVNIQSYRQSAEGEVEKIKIDTPWVINSLTGSDQDTKPAKNLQLVLLNYCTNLKVGAHWLSGTRTRMIWRREPMLHVSIARVP